MAKVQALVKRVDKVSPLVTEVKNVMVEYGSPWGVELLASCVMADVVRNMSPSPSIDVAVLYCGRTTHKVGTVGLDLLNKGWEALLQDAASSAVTYLHTRDVHVPDSFREELRQALAEARTTAILAVVRHQAVSLIHEIPAAEACRIWAEEEARHIFES